MGTSSSNGGPSGNGGLLPTWYGGGSGNPEMPPPTPTPDDQGGDNPDSPPGDERQLDRPIPRSAPLSAPVPGKWKDAKSAMTRFSKRTGGRSLSKTAKVYMKALGGSGAATRSSARGIAAGGSLANFLGGVSSGGAGGGGFNQTLANLGLADYVGQSSELTLVKIADAIAPAGSTNEEAIARDAILATLGQLYTKAVANGGDLTILETLTPEMIKDAVIEYVSCFIYKKWIYELGLALEKNGISENQAIQMENQIKDFIGTEVKACLQNKTIQQLDLNSSENQSIIENIFQLAYSILE